MKIGFILFLLFFMPMWLHCQEVVTKDNAPKQVLKLYEKAQKCLDKNKSEEAAEKLISAIEKEPAFIDAHLRLGGIYFDNKQYQRAADQFKKALEIDSAYNIRAYQAVAQSLEADQQYGEAIAFYRKYLSKSDKIKEGYRNEVIKKIADFEFRQFALENPVPFEPQALPVEINSPQFSEYLPSLTADGRRLFFTRVTGNQEDIYYSEKDSAGQWSEAIPLPNLNTDDNEGAHSISADGKTILFTSCTDGRNGTARGCNIYAAFLREGRWTKPRYFDALNSNAWDSQPTISSDGRTIIFASKRPGGQGESDLWWSRRNKEGKWAAPENLGKTINTSLREESPFLHPDGKTLYFKSEGHPGMGSFDLFTSTLDEDGRWTAPVNLGYPINTEAHEGAMIVSLDGTTAYYSRGSSMVNFDKEKSDLFTYSLPKGAQASPVGFVNIKVFDAVSRESLTSKISIQSSSGSNQSLSTDSEGEALIILPVGENFSLNIDQNNYYFHSERFELDSVNASETAFEIEVYLRPVEEMVISEPIILRNVLFPTGSYELEAESYFELDNLVSLLKENSEIKIEIRGHTDDVGDDERNQVLSENRAKAVYNYLIQQGIASDRLSYIGLGESQPISTNDTAEGKKMNRRTEFITKQ